MSTRRRQGGFALAMVLWVLAGLAVVAATVASQAYTNAMSVKLLREQVNSERAVISATARAVVIASTALPRPLSMDSLSGRLLLDGRTMLLNKDERISFQDVRGLVHLGKASARRVTALMRLCGADERQAAELADVLADYQDGDDLKRLQGAETFEYRAKGLPPPRNSPLLSVNELRRLLGMEELAARWAEHQCDELVSTQGDGNFNRNTAPLGVLMMDGLDEAAARALISARGDGLPEQLGAGQNGPTNPFNWTGIGSVGKVMRVRHQLQPIEWCSEFVLELTPSTGDRPWLISHPKTLNCQLPVEGRETRFPAVGFQVPERERAQFNVAPRLPLGN
ncbi:MAG: hypothetical protein EOP38_23750 [Rubrivivax sp.]|nr:MAG: hypothetical protein EOP38_23750 [Rubrivivax sp.]